MAGGALTVAELVAHEFSSTAAQLAIPKATATVMVRPGSTSGSRRLYGSRAGHASVRAQRDTTTGAPNTGSAGWWYSCKVHADAVIGAPFLMGHYGGGVRTRPATILWVSLPGFGLAPGLDWLG